MAAGGKETLPDSHRGPVGQSLRPLESLRSRTSPTTKETTPPQLIIPGVMDHSSARFLAGLASGWLTCAIGLEHPTSGGPRATDQPVVSPHGRARAFALDRRG